MGVGFGKGEVGDEVGVFLFRKISILVRLFKGLRRGEESPISSCIRSCTFLPGSQSHGERHSLWHSIEDDCHE